MNEKLCVTAAFEVSEDPAENSNTGGTNRLQGRVPSGVLSASILNTNEKR